MIWIPEFDKYFVDTLSTITVPDINGDPVPITAQYHMPGKEGTEDADAIRPGVAFSNYDAVHDVSRESSFAQTRLNSTPTEISVKDGPIPWNLYYEFRIVSDYREHNVLMETAFLKLFKPRGYISVTDPSDNSVEGFDFFLIQVLPGDGYLQTTDNGTTEKRIFRKIYRYKLMTEMDFATAVAYKKVLETNTTAELL